MSKSIKYPKRGRQFYVDDLSHNVALTDFPLLSDDFLLLYREAKLFQETHWTYPLTDILKYGPLAEKCYDPTRRYSNFDRDRLATEDRKMLPINVLRGDSPILNWTVTRDSVLYLVDSSHHSVIAPPDRYIVRWQSDWSCRSE